MTADDTYEEPQATDKKSKFDLNEPEEEQLEVNEDVQQEIVEQEELEPVEEVKAEPTRKRKPRKE